MTALRDQLLAAREQLLSRGKLNFGAQGYLADLEARIAAIDAHEHAPAIARPHHQLIEIQDPRVGSYTIEIPLSFTEYWDELDHEHDREVEELLNPSGSRAEDLRRELEADLRGGYRERPRRELHGEAGRRMAELEEAEAAIVRPARRVQERELAGVVIPRDVDAARHDTGHVVKAVAAGIATDFVTGERCWLKQPLPVGMEGAVFALAGEAVNRFDGRGRLIEHDLGRPHNVLNSSLLGASEIDLRLAQKALGPNATPWHWREARRQALAFVDEWQLGIEAVARVLMRSGRLTGDEVWTLLEKTYRSEAAHYCATLRAARAKRAAA